MEVADLGLVFASATAFSAATATHGRDELIIHSWLDLVSLLYSLATEHLLMSISKMAAVAAFRVTLEYV